MAYDPRAIANYFLTLAEEKNEPLTSMKIQKLVYFANGWHLAIKDAPLINEQVEAWPYGPVIPTLYWEFRRFGNQPITEDAGNTFDEFTEMWTMSSHTVWPSLDDEAGHAEFTKSFLNRIWDTYSQYTAVQLSNETHRPGSPWDQVRQQYDGAIPKGTDIRSETMRLYFKSLARPVATAR